MEIVCIPVGFLQENCYLVYDEKMTAAVIDPGDEAQRLIDQIERLQLHVKHILLTHGHYDHTGAVPMLMARYGAKLCIAKEDEEMLSNPQLSLAMKQRWKPEEAKVDQLLVDGDVVQVGALSFTVLATPGHSKGSVTYQCENTLFTGDTLFAGDCGRTDLYGGDYGQIKASLRRLSQLPGDYRVLPGHGPESTLEQERLHNTYMRTE